MLVGWRKALKYLKTLKDDKDVHLTEEQRADAVAYTAMLQGPLREALVGTRSHNRSPSVLAASYYWLYLHSCLVCSCTSSG